MDVLTEALIDLTYNPAQKRDSHGRWYHGTTDLLWKNRIQHEGLKSSLSGRVSLTADPAEAEEYARRAAATLGGKPLVVEASGLDPARLGPSPAADHTVHHGPIAAEHLDVHAAAALKRAIHGDVEDLETMVRADQGPTRIHMPQLSGVPLPGSKADALPHAPGQEVDLTDQFEKELRAKGISVTDTQIKISDLHPTQDQLVMSEVAGLADFMLTAPPTSSVFEPIFVSSDDHVIDGHHRWAAREVRARINDTPDETMAARQIGVPITEALSLATQFMDEWGLPRAGVGKAGATVSNFAPSLSNVVADLLLANPAYLHEARDPHSGEWTSGIRDALAKKVTEVKLGDTGDSLLGAKVADYHRSLANVQTLAQKTAEAKYRKASGGDGLYENPDALIYMKPSPERSWGLYQMDGGYQAINGTMRGDKDAASHGRALMSLNGVPPFDTGQMTADMVEAFDTMGFTTTHAGTLYRAVDRSKVPLADLKVGGLFSDTGVVSTSASQTEVAGFIEGGQGIPPVSNPLMLEIQVPAGTRLLGGAPDGIETMLKPGTVFKVVAHKKTKVKPYGTPGYGMAIKGGTFDTVVLEVQP